MKPTTKIKLINGNYHVVFTIDSQTFTLVHFGGAKKDAEWQKELLDKAFDKLLKK